MEEFKKKCMNKQGNQLKSTENQSRENTYGHEKIRVGDMAVGQCIINSYAAQIYKAFYL